MTKILEALHGYLQSKVTDLENFMGRVSDLRLNAITLSRNDNKIPLPHSPVTFITHSARSVHDVINLTRQT